MTDENQATANHSMSDGVADAIATVAVMTIVIGTVVYWLSGFPA
jgi:hypothetical protein